MLDSSSCGIHTLHNAFKTAIILATSWNLFCPIRWLDNIAVRALEMPHLHNFLIALEKEMKKPTSACFITLEKHIKDPLIGPKHAFFKSIASDVPVTSFLYSAPLFKQFRNGLLSQLLLASIDVQNTEKIFSTLIIDLLDILSKNHLDGTSNDKAVREYKRVCVDKAEKLVTFKHNEDCLYSFWMQLLGSDDKYSIRLVFQLILILSRGNTNLERGISINPE
ncbi:hypothetical protein PR048_015337 [Dryococelus australis]|uniref:Uncharacterized protein n=1 Tax=Dryococelus australis TaxID=614101 RepID=A0ABQ9HHP2_9NEOP|nr:hypothetical protein PR048_015337 [Dryococelus australis]